MRVTFMSITITGGISFSGGVGITAAPPSTATAGWFGGGQPSTSQISRITFATDTATATVRGSLSSVRYGTAGTGTLTYGYWGGGYTGSAGLPYTKSIVDRLTFSTDTSVASTQGPLSLARSNAGATSDGTTYGWWGGGYSNAPSYIPYSRVDRITYATDTATASVRGPLASGRFEQGAAGNTNYAWHVAGGYPNLNSVNRIEYANDTATASFRVTVTSRRQLAGTGNLTYGWFGGGYLGPRTSLVERIDYANDTAAASTRGPLTLSARYLSATGDISYGWFNGMETSTSNTSTVCRITYATDTATATDRGPMTSTSIKMSGTSGVQ